MMVMGRKLAVLQIEVAIVKKFGIPNVRGSASQHEI